MAASAGFQVPAVAVSSWPTFAVPEMVGTVTFTTEAAATAAVAAEVAFALV